MTAPAGTPAFHRKESRKAEANHKRWVAEIVGEYNHFKIVYSLPITEWISIEKNKYAWLKNGKPQTINPDGGFIMYEDKPIGVCEHKHQVAKPNACERAFKYLTIFKPQQIFVSTTGPGFVCVPGGGSTGPMLEMAMYAGMCVLENADEPEFKKTLRNWLDALV
jgi:hypothetical protein